MYVQKRKERYNNNNNQNNHIQNSLMCMLVVQLFSMTTHTLWSMLTLSEIIKVALCERSSKGGRVMHLTRMVCDIVKLLNINALKHIFLKGISIM
jgi:hypothetical protein